MNRSIVVLCLIAAASFFSPRAAGAVTCDGLTVPVQNLGGSGNDHITGTSADDAMHGQGGNDLMEGRDGSDHICGGAGADDLEEAYPPNFTNGNDHMFGMDGCDGERANTGADQLHGGAGNDTGYPAYGGCFNYGLYGYDGDNDDMWGDFGNDYVNGGNGISDWADCGGGTQDVFNFATTETAINCEIQE